MEYRTEWNTEPTEPIFGRTDLRNGVSEAKFDVEADFDVEKSKIGPKSAKNHEKTKKKSRKNFRKEIFLASKNRKLQIVRNAFSQSFVTIRAKYRTDRTDRLDRAIARPIVPTEGHRVCSSPHSFDRTLFRQNALKCSRTTENARKRPKTSETLEMSKTSDFLKKKFCNHTAILRCRGRRSVPFRAVPCRSVSFRFRFVFVSFSFRFQ